MKILQRVLRMVVVLEFSMGDTKAAEITRAWDEQTPVAIPALGDRPFRIMDYSFVLTRELSEVLSLHLEEV